MVPTLVNGDALCVVLFQKIFHLSFYGHCSRTLSYTVNRHCLDGKFYDTVLNAVEKCCEMMDKNLSKK